MPVLVAAGWHQLSLMLLVECSHERVFLVGMQVDWRSAGALFQASVTWVWLLFVDQALGYSTCVHSGPQTKQAAVAQGKFFPLR